MTTLRAAIARHPGTYRSAAREDAWTSLWFLLPVLAVFLILIVVPLCQSFVFSLTDYDGYSSDLTFVGLQNYRTVFTEPSLLVGLGFTLLFSVAVTVFVTVLAIPLAVALNQVFFGRNFARAVFFFLGVPAQAILGLIWRYLFSPLKSGAINQALAAFGVPPVPWLADDNLARFAVIFVAVWAQVGWHATLYLAFLQAIPTDLYEQSQVDGANSRQQFMHVTLPQLVPGMVISAFLLMSGSLKVYDLPYTMTDGGPGFATNTITQSIINRGIGQADFGVGSALAILFAIATMIVILAQLLLSQAVSRRFE